MSEDAQPNERATIRKGASIPICPTQAFGSKGLRVGGSFQRGLGGYSQQRPLNRPTGTFQLHDQQHGQLQKGSQILYDPDNVKRKQTDSNELPTQSYESLPESPKPPLLAASRLPAKPKKRKAHPEPLELLIDLPPQCRKGARDCKRLRRNWQAEQIAELSIQTGVPVRWAGCIQDYGRFVLDDTPSGPQGGGSNNSQGESSTLGQPSVPSIPDVLLMNTSNTDDEIIIVEDVDTLDTPNEWFSPSLHMQSSTDFLQHSSPRAPDCLLTTSPKSPRRAFKSGTLIIASRPTASDQGQLSSTSTIMPPNISPELSCGSSSTPFFHTISSDEDEGVLPAPDQEGDTGSRPLARTTSPTNSSAVWPLSFFSHNDLGTEACSNLRFTGRTTASETGTIQLPLSQSDKVRRIMHIDTGSITSVSMRGSVELFNVEPLRHQRTLKPQRPAELIDDACILQAGSEYLMVFGHKREQGQISCCRFRAGAAQYEWVSLPRPWNNTKRGGVSVVTTMIQPMQFATGGYDHVVHLWDVKSDLSSASPQTLAIKHTSQVQSLLPIRDTSHKLVTAGADCNVHIWDLSSERVVNTLRPSNATYHLHTTISPFCTLLEVAHRELQFEVRDHRLVPERPVMRFGYATDKVDGRFIKGATSYNLFACGSREGSIRLWDLRNVETSATKAEACRGQKIVQVVFKDSAKLVACAANGHITLLNYNTT